MQTAKIVGASLLIPAAATLVWRMRQAPKAHTLRLGRVELKLSAPRRLDSPLIAGIATTFVGAGILALERAGLLPAKR